MSSPLRPDEGEALADWAARVRANREQVERVREVGEGADFYAGMAGRFRADPHRRDDPGLDLLLELARPDDTWLDIGSGAGRFALPLAVRGVRVVAIDPSMAMLTGLRAGMTEHGVEEGPDGIEILEGRWPLPDIHGDVSLAANVGYDIEAIAPFLDAMEAASGRFCVLVMADRAPSSVCDPLWPPVHGEERAALPALPESVALLLARGRRFEVRVAERSGSRFETPDEALAFARRQLWLEPGSAKDRRLQAVLQERLVEERPANGESRFSFGAGPAVLGIVRWWPPDRRM